MKIKSIELKNFKPFKGDNNKFDFDSDDHQPVILVKANNGSGKTSFLMGLKWAFYGVSGLVDYRTTEPNLVNRVAKTEKDGVVSVRVVFKHNDSTYDLKRSCKFSKVDRWDKSASVFGKRFTVDKNGVSEVDSLNKQEWDERAIESYVDGILPQDASQFFFFDGELIRGYTEKPQDPRVKDSIQMVLGIQELLNAEKDFKSELIPDYGRLLSQNAGRVDKTQEIAALDLIIALYCLGVVIPKVSLVLFSKLRAFTTRFFSFFNPTPVIADVNNSRLYLRWYLFNSPVVIRSILL